MINGEAEIEGKGRGQERDLREESPRVVSNSLDTPRATLCGAGKSILNLQTSAKTPRAQGVTLKRLNSPGGGVFGHADVPIKADRPTADD